MFGRRSLNENVNDVSFSFKNEILYPLAILGVLISNTISLTIIGMIIKENNELSNTLLLLPLNIIVLLNVMQLKLKVIRLSVFCMALGYVLYDLFVLYYSKNLVINLIYLMISLIQLVCGYLSLIS